MQIKSNRLIPIGTFFLFLLAVVLFSYYEYNQNKTKLYQQIDEKLITSAQGAALILPYGFHDRAVDASSISQADDDINIDRLSRFAKNMHVVYLYTMILKDGIIHFTASSATDEERKSGINLTRYFDIYEDDFSGNVKKVFQTNKPIFENSTDRWGSFRSVMIPMKSPGGNVYVAGADIKIDTINHILKEEAIALFIRLLILIGLSLPFLTWRLREINRNLQNELEKGEKNLKQSHLEIQAILDATLESIFLLDKNGIVISINKTAASRLHKEPSELIGRRIYDFFPPEVAYRRKSNIENIFATGKMLSVEDRRDDMYFALNYYPVFDENNMVISVAIFAQEITERKKAEEHIHLLTNFDPLTGLPNRQKLLIDLEEHQPTSCAIFNVDNFKEINDFFGINAGDSLLYSVGQWFKEMGCFAYRIGGDEFAILFYETLTHEQLNNRIAALLSALDDERFIIEHETLDIRMNVGAATGSDKLITRADIALHRAKERKIPIAFYEESENVEQQYQKNIAMASSIRKALANGRIFCHYQPILNTVTGKIDKYETLVRMIDEEGSIIAPMQFLPIAKKTKLYPRITLEVLHQACRLFSSRNEEFSINLSIDDIHDPSTVREILSTIERTHTASRIVFEILESDGIENYGEVARFIDQVKQLGAKIAIDDFGTGYSNFEHILKLNVDYIKIDGSLIREIADNPRHQIIVETIIDFAKKMGAKTIAEFVSDERIFNAIKTYGIDYSQGYYTGKPEPLS
ncbi:putative bifunctional diguanylate cyclase/phosphodiesterase [Sulfuricurvum sp.]|uniref:putative bifunctional diguanylate cyclase/phosphodiesterase n=1 Tax=Sulfuricurvum sp. TaxID=2025608 RepID=UPI003BAF83EA